METKCSRRILITGLTKQIAKNLTSLSSLEISASQTRPNRNTVNPAVQQNTPKPSLWEIFKSNLLPKSQAEKSVDQNVDSVTAASENHNNYEPQDHIPESSEISESVWNPLDKWRSTARKSIILSFLTNLGKKHLSSVTVEPEQSHQARHVSKSPVDLELNFNIDPHHKHGKLIHDSLKTFLKVQNSILNHILGKHGQPLLKTVETAKEPSLHDLVVKPFTDLLSAHSLSQTNTISQPHKNTVEKHPNDLTASHSESKPLWNAWEAYPWKKSPTWDPWSYNYHIQRPETEGSILKFWRSLLWKALRAKKNIVVTKAKFLPLLATIKTNLLKRILERIAHREQSPTFQLLRIIRNALWKGKKAFLKKFLSARDHVSSFKSKLKHFKVPEKSTEKPPQSYGSGQDISQVHLTYSAPQTSPAPDRYHSISRPVASSYSSWSSASSPTNSEIYDLLPPIIDTIEDNQPSFSGQTVSSTIKPTGFKFSSASSKPLNSNNQTPHTGSSTIKPIYSHSSSDTDSASDTYSYGEIVPVPFTVENIYSTGKNSQPSKKDESFSAKLLQLRLNH